MDGEEVDLAEVGPLRRAGGRCCATLWERKISTAVPVYAGLALDPDEALARVDDEVVPVVGPVGTRTL